MTPEELKLLVKVPVSTLESVTGLQEGEILFYDTTTPDNKLKKISIDTFNNLSKTAKPLKPTDPTPTAQGLYKPTISGTYANAGGLIAQEGYDTLFFLNGSTWTKTETKFPQASQSIVPFSTSTFPLVAPVPPLAPIQRTYENKIWQLNDGKISTSVDFPNNNSGIWKLIGNVDVVDETQIITDVFTVIQSGSDNDTSTFSGFGFTYGAIKGFNRIVLPIWQRAATTDEVTKVYLRIREIDYQGTLLFDGFKDVTIPQGTQQDVTFDFNLIENLANKNIWVEFVCDGLTRLNYSTSLPAQNYRYKNTAQGTSHFDPLSTPGFSPKNPMAISFKKLTNGMSLIPELVSEKVEVGDTNPVSSNGVYEEFSKYDSVIADGFQTETSVVKGAETLGNTSSTIKGWGQLFAGLVNFNRVGYIFRAFDNTMIPTKVRCVIRKTSSEGTIVFDQTKDVSLLLNTNKKFYFDLPELYTNSGNDELFISFFANGMIASFVGTLTSDLDANHVLKYTVTSLSDTASTNASNVRQQLYVEILKGHFVKQISDIEIQRIATQIGQGGNIFTTPDVIVPSVAWLYPTSEYNIFNRNAVVPNFGDNLDRHRIDFNSTVGGQYLRGFRLNSTSASLNANVTINLMKGRDIIISKTQNLLSGAIANGTGVNRNILIIGDSTIDGGDINIPLKSIFDADSMDLTFIGTRGSTGLKHEGRGGWTIADYYGNGRKLFRVDVTGLTNSPTLGTVYRQAVGNDFTVVEVNITAGTGYFKLERLNGNLDLETNGILTKQSGIGDSIINYTGSIADSANPFYSPTTLKFDLGTYLTNTGQTLSANDWIFFQLGINDVFGLTTLDSAATKVTTMITQLNEMLANITAYNPSIRVGIVITIPPANQDAFGFNYTTVQLSEMYRTTGLVTFQKKLIETYDNATQRGLLRYLISAHLNLDTEYNFPATDYAVNSRNTKTISMQNNGVHPDANGNYQIADMYAGLIKYLA